eukprot:3936714-Rhodomonas_salina.1
MLGSASGSGCEAVGWWCLGEGVVAAAVLSRGGDEADCGTESQCELNSSKPSCRPILPASGTL